MSPDAREEYRRASARWRQALVASAEAPPDAAFPGRLREVATAANQQSAAFELLAAARMGWRPRPGASAMELSYEGARSRPGPPELWERFDQAVRALGDAYEGISLAEIARAFGALARVAHEIGDELEQAVAVAGRARRPA